MLHIMQVLQNVFFFLASLWHMVTLAHMATQTRKCSTVSAMASPADYSKILVVVYIAQVDNKL